MTSLLSVAQRDLVYYLTRGDRPFDISARIGDHDLNERFTGALKALGVKNPWNAAARAWNHGLFVHATAARRRSRPSGAPGRQKNTDVRAVLNQTGHGHQEPR